jgi:DNA processing protein
MEEYPIVWHTPDTFPLSLKEIPQPPKRLSVRGTLPSKELIPIAIIGSRSYSAYGKQVCESLIKGLAGYPICIVSGLALGMDSIAHREALNQNICTVAFPGAGLGERVIYPRQHYELAKEILQSGGALISEFDEDFKATLWSFPQRNRLVAGYARMTIVIEAGIKSGARITAKLATEYGKSVGAVPGNIFHESSKGAHALIQQGALPITCAEDILAELGLAQSLPLLDGLDSFIVLSDDEKEMLSHLSGPQTPDELAEALGWDSQKLSIVTTTLEVKGVVRVSFGYIERTR